jgi:hypothetical protein
MARSRFLGAGDPIRKIGQDADVTVDDIKDFSASSGASSARTTAPGSGTVSSTPRPAGVTPRPAPSNSAAGTPRTTSPR